MCARDQLLLLNRVMVVVEDSYGRLVGKERWGAGGRGYNKLG